MSTETTPFDREAAKKKAEDQSRKKDIKQHADKILQRLTDLQPSDTKRAIWELFQNALDLTDEATIELEHHADRVIYRHHGKVFNSDTLISLIKQVSSKDGPNNEDEVGQYGTGFITTHSFGKRIILDSVLEYEGLFLPITNFEIDRSPKDTEGLQQTILDAETKVYDLYQLNPIPFQQNQSTQFSYLTETGPDKINALEAFQSIDLYLPYVFALNPKLKKVKVKYLDGKTVQYKRFNETNNGDIEIVTIWKNGSKEPVYSIHSTNTSIILPWTTYNTTFEFPEELSRLFLFYPLIGSENFGINFLIHSKKFTPFTERNGIHLSSAKDQTKEKELQNRALIAEATERIFRFVEQHISEVDNPLNFATINFNTNSKYPLLNKYFEELKEKWTSKFESLPLVKTLEGSLHPKNVVFFDQELLKDSEKFYAIYSIASKFYKNIPVKDLTTRWSQIIDEWNIEDTNYLSLELLAEKIQEEINLSAFDEFQLKTFYQYIIDQNQESLFNRFRLLPNIAGEFFQLSDLNSTMHINDYLIDIATVIMPNVPKKHIHDNFKFQLEIATFQRSDFSKEYNIEVQSLIDEMYKTNTSLDESILKAMFGFCKIFPDVNNESNSSKLVKQLLVFNGYSSQLTPIINIKDDELNNNTARKNLIRASLFNISKKGVDWVKENESDLLEILNCIDAFESEDYKKILNTHHVFPNQFYELCKYDDLRRDVSIPDKLKDWYDDIITPDIDIRGTLILENFKKFLPTSRTMTPSDVGKEIEEVLTENGQYHSISDHEFANQIFGIIEYITNDEKKAGWFPNLNSQKAEITLSKVTDGSTKDSVFKILNLSNRHLNKLGELAGEADIDAIIDAGKKAIEEKKGIERDFQFKHKIGKHIENLIKREVDSAIQSFEIKSIDDQNGQDLIIKVDNEVVYYIEVKSRWSPETSITMSDRQMQRGADNKEKYSLIVADLAGYTQEPGKDRFEVPDIDTIREFIFVDNEIGDSLHLLLVNNPPKEQLDEKVSLTGDYRALIPIKKIREGLSLEVFIRFLIKTLKLKIKDA